MAERFRDHGIELRTPDLNEPDFSTLTVTRMVTQVTAAADAAAAGGVVLIGSSLGGFVAVQAALQRPGSVSALVLLAPALEFNRLRTFGGVTLSEWKRTGRLDVFHYGYGRMLPVHYELYSDACGYDCQGAGLAMPIQVFQGRRDTAVDPDSVERWAAQRPNVELHMLDDDHQLTESVGYIWNEMRRFLRLDGDPASGPGGPGASAAC